MLKISYCYLHVHVLAGMHKLFVLFGTQTLDALKCKYAFEQEWAYNA